MQESVAIGLLYTKHNKYSAYRISVSYYMKTESMWSFKNTVTYSAEKSSDMIVEAVIVLHTSLSIKCSTSK